ncbi:M23 family metallopeptidase [Desmospora profundinema]|uniref:Stage II sporulation protein Q n=1 Tax=Desmospora profundinema TaxID=1571184 RepID=A0ABU1IL81_9BACL|nr:M23 family metallopeptidase [Desmospora profundinema]MDR6225537.1 stage II sporulation protein Q [Desmospora profundinema]
MKPEDNKPNKSVEKISSLKWKRLFSKKWFFPAVYLAAAALILSLVWWYQGAQDLNVTNPNTGLEKEWGQEPVPASQQAENMRLPFQEDAEAVETMGYYDEAGSEKSKQAALIKYANTYWPHSGINYARKDGKTFDVLATLDGKVVRVEEHPLNGQQVELDHGDGLMTVYQSLDQIQVKEGQTLSQGDVIGKAGRNKFEKEAGIHLHYEVRKDGEAVNPASYLND